MDKIQFSIWNYGDMCRITANNCLSSIRSIADGACIMDINVLLHEIESISDQCEKLGYTAIFVNESHKEGKA